MRTLRSVLPKTPGVGRGLQRVGRERGGKPHRGRGRLDGRAPFVPGGVPVELVGVGEVGERVADLVADHVDGAPHHGAVRVADADVDVAALVAHLRLVGRAVLVVHVQEPEAEGVRVPLGIGVPDGYRAVDAVTRLGEVHLEPLLDPDEAVGLHGKVGVEAPDDDRRPRRRGRRRVPSLRAAARTQHQGQAANAAVHGFISTRGAWASAASSSSKNSRSRKPRGRATRRSGNDWTRVLKSRTTAL